MSETKKEQSREEVFEFLNQRNTAVLSTISSEFPDQPHSAMVHYIVEKDLSMYFITRRHTRKFADLIKNPKVSLVIGSATDSMNVQCEGKAVLVDEEGYLKDFLSKPDNRLKLSEVYSDKAGSAIFPKLEGVDLALFKIHIDWLRFVNY